MYNESKDLDAQNCLSAKIIILEKQFKCNLINNFILKYSKQLVTFKIFKIYYIITKTIKH